MVQQHEKISENKTYVTAAYAGGGANAVQLKDNRKYSVVQRKLAERSTTTQLASFMPIQRKTNHTGLPDSLKSGIENLSGHSMDDVKVHYNSDKPSQLNAHAYAQGTDIHIASGQEKHLPHEAWHVVQQKQGRVKPTLQMKGKVNVNDDEGLEKEADVMGAKAIQFNNVQRKSSGIEIPKHKLLSLNKVTQRAMVFQRKIRSNETKEKIKKNYENHEIEPEKLDELLQVAFKTTNNYDEAIAQIDSKIKHDNTINAPDAIESPAESSMQISKEMIGKNKTIERPKIDISIIRNRAAFKSSVPEENTSEEKLKEEWGKLNTEDFYAKIRKMLKIARNPEHKDNKGIINKLDELINGYKQHKSVKEMIHNSVRVKAVKAKGATSGTGLDELFKTSETMKYLELSYRPPKDMKAVAKFDGHEFDWMDAQEQIRLSTEFIIWAGDLVDEISGHTGTFQNTYRNKWMTTKQSLMHEIRDEAISKRSNPATGVIEAIATHLRITENEAGFVKEKYTGAKASTALTTDGHSVNDRYEEILADIRSHRDTLKWYLQDFREKAKVDGISSPFEARHGGSDYHSESPRYDKDDMKMQKSGKVDGNTLYNLAPQWRKTHGSPAKEIPPKPENPVIIEANNIIIQKLNNTKKKSIHKAAKAQAKNLKEDADPDTIEIKKIEVYIKRLTDEKSKIKEIVEIIKKLEKEKASLTKKSL